MKYLYLLFGLVNSGKIIKNINIPSCRNCIHYKPRYYSEFTSSLNTCEKFGEKNIITDEITYDFADLCRKDEQKCGKEGKFFEKEENLERKILKHKIINGLPNFLLVGMMYFIICLYFTN